MESDETKEITKTFDLERTKPFFLITGMARSGTSFLARALNLCGVYLGDLQSLISHEWSPQPDNPRGHWQHKRLFELAQETLAINNGSAYDPPDNIMINEELGQEIMRSVEELINFPSLAAGFKDPRIILCLDSWLKYLPKNIVIIGIFRHPLKVTESLKHVSWGRKYNFSYETSLRLWKIYNQKLLSLLEKHQGCLINFDWPKDRLLSEIHHLAHNFALVEADLAKWYTEELRHSDHIYPFDYNLTNDITSLYSELIERSNKNSGVSVKHINRTAEELMQIITSMVLERQARENYFSDLYHDLIMERAFTNRYFPPGSKRRKILKFSMNFLEGKMKLRK